jgi:tRNA G10  N-methylase Trm11
MTGKKRYLFYFAQELLDFRYPEFVSLTRLFNIDVSEMPPKENFMKPILILKMHESEAKQIASRSVLLSEWEQL